MKQSRRTHMQAAWLVCASAFGSLVPAASFAQYATTTVASARIQFTQEDNLRRTGTCNGQALAQIDYNAGSMSGKWYYIAYTRNVCRGALFTPPLTIRTAFAGATVTCGGSQTIGRGNGVIAQNSLVAENYVSRYDNSARRDCTSKHRIGFQYAGSTSPGGGGPAGVRWSPYYYLSFS